MEVGESQLIPIGQVGNCVTPRVSRATAHRWAKVGVRGIKLESVMVGGRVFTTSEALARFICELSADRAFIIN